MGKNKKIFELLADNFSVVEIEYKKFQEKSNKAAGKRARKAALQVHKLAKELRKDISAQLKK